jgi:hypothetical protein
MTRDALDRILSSEDQIVPSSGFAASVMDAVRREAATPPPIPFPWKRALPGFALGVVALATLLLVGFALRGPAAPADATSAYTLPQLLAAGRVAAAKADGDGWAALAILLTLASVFFSLRATGSGT